MFVGGEFYYDGRWVVERPVISTESMLFLNGGAACLTLICDALRDRGIRQVLLPSYLCPTILNTIARAGLTWEFYQVHSDFSVDQAGLAQRMAANQAVYFINYFGFLHSAETLAFFQELRRSGFPLIEDNAQAGFHEHPAGDYVFNSLRKFVPYDGGYVSAPGDLSPYLQKYQGRPNHRLALIRRYRSQLAGYLLEGTGSHAELEQCFAQAERFYETEGVVEGDEQERLAIERLDWPGIRQARRDHYEYLLSFLATIPEVAPIFPALQAGNMPLGLPIYLSGVSRDRVRQELGNAAVGLWVHWEEILEDPRLNHNEEAAWMARHILTLVIDQRTSYKQLDYQVYQLRRAIAAARE